MERRFNADVVDLEVDTADKIIRIVGTTKGKDVPDGYEVVKVAVNYAQAKWLRHNMKRLIKVLEDNGD